MRDLVDETFANRYRLIARVAGGGMGEVYRGHDLLLDRPVAVKVLQPSLAVDPELVARFKAEARAAARLTHPNVVAVYDWGAEDEHTYYMVMEYVAGTDLRDLLVMRGCIEPAHAVEIMASVCDALAAAHAVGLIHRDVKPENVLIDRHGKVKVADFGIAIVAGNDVTMPGGTIPGTLRYIAPEQAQGRETSPSTDVWAAGAVLSELLTGRPPLQGSGAEMLRRRAEEPLAAPSESMDNIPPDLDAVVAKACALDPADRYRDASEMGAALRRVAVRSMPDTPPVTSLLDDVTSEIRLTDMQETAFAPRSSRPYRKLRLGRLLVTAILLAVLIAGGAKAIGSIFGPHPVKVPTVVGISKQRALRVAEARGLRLTVTHRMSSLVAPRGRIIGQSPETGELDQGSKLGVIVSSGKPLAHIPDVIGYGQSQAQVVLRAAQLEPGQVTQKYSAKPEGQVVALSPASGKLPWGATVDLVISRGPRPIGVPDVAGLTVDKAKKQLKGQGFTVTVSSDFSNSVLVGHVIATTPAAGSQAPQGSAITLVVSQGPRYKELTMPDVRNLSVAEARAKLESLNLVVRVVQSCGGSGSVVTETDPIAGSPVREHTRVALFVC
ncbi:MAG: PASTA domain-containing protein [Actinomycetota bacterium]|nr:PASTA domain-containing protein [Actinomycetota bacterium]